MTNVENIMKQMPFVYKPQIQFMLDFFEAMAAFIGRATMANLSRYGAGSERRIARWSRHWHGFDFMLFNMFLLELAGVFEHKVCAVMDATFLPKSGKHTEGLAWFHNGSASRQEKGLEGIALGLVDRDEHTAYALDIAQTPAELPEGQTRMDFYLNHFTQHAKALLPYTRYLLADGGFSNKKFVNGVKDAGFDLISKLRADANLRYFYEGPKTSGPGRKRVYDGKVDLDQLDLSRWEVLASPFPNAKVFSAVVNHKRWGCSLRVVMIRGKGNSKRKTLLFSTDTTLSGLEIIEMYQERFLIEFLFRDSKQFTGLGHAQVRDSSALTFFMNGALSTLNLLRLKDRDHSGIFGPRVISIAAWKRRKYNEKFIERISVNCGLDLEAIKSHPGYENACNFGVQAA